MKRSHSEAQIATKAKKKELKWKINNPDVIIK